jgi:uncharacterized protein YbjT (DUF2867 family)
VRGAGRNVADLNFPGVIVNRFDWEDSTSWPGVLAGVEVVYLVKPKTPDPAGTVASFLRSAGSIERVVLLSEIDASNRDESTDERKVERVIEALPIAWTILRPNWFMQNFAEPSFYLEDIRDAAVLRVPAGGQPTSFVDTRDIADVATAALLDSGHQVRHIDPSLNEYLEALSGKGTAKATVEYYQRIYGCMQDGRTSTISEDIEQVTGRPARTFSAFVAENKDVWRRESAPH